jgi:regulator of replication initiation timing
MFRGEQMTRKEELLKIFDQIDDTKGIIAPMIDDVVFLELRLQELRQLPFIRVNPKNPADQKPTPAAKQYKELLQQYNNCIKILTGVLRKDAPEEDSPLRAFLNSRRKEHES